MCPLERNLYGHPLAGLLWERHMEKTLFKLGWHKIPGWECLYAHREKGLFMSVYVDDFKMVGRSENLSPMWATLCLDLDLEPETTLAECVPGMQPKRNLYSTRDNQGQERALPQADHPRRTKRSPTRITIISPYYNPSSTRSSSMELRHDWTRRTLCTKMVRTNQ